MWDWAFWNIITEWLRPRSGWMLFWIIWRRWSRAYQWLPPTLAYNHWYALLLLVIHDSYYTYRDSMFCTSFARILNEVLHKRMVYAWNYLILVVVHGNKPTNYDGKSICLKIHLPHARGIKNTCDKVGRGQYAVSITHSSSAHLIRTIYAPTCIGYSSIFKLTQLTMYACLAQSTEHAVSCGNLTWIITELTWIITYLNNNWTWIITEYRDPGRQDLCIQLLTNLMKKGR